MEYQIRHYKIRPGTMSAFLDAWLKGVYLLRQRFGFTFAGAWRVEGRDEFIWIIGYDGPEGLESADKRYYDSSERKRMDPDPAQYIEQGGTKLMLRSVLPDPPKAKKTVRILTVHPAIERVRAHAAAQGVALDVRRYPAGTHTAEDAARAIGCDVAQIVKSLVFLTAGDAVIVLVSGMHRADEAKVAAAVGVPSVRRATAKEARDNTGFVVGGIPPFGHSPTICVLVDDALLAHPVVWAAAGLPDAVFPIAPDELVRVTRARVADIRASEGASAP